MSVLDVVNSTLAHQTRAYEAQFRAAEPFPHLVLDDFLAPDFADKLLADFPRFDEERAKNELGQLGRKSVHEKLADVSPNYRQLDALFKSEPFRELVGGLTGIPSLLYDPDYFGGGTHHNLHGQELDVHVDFNYLPNRPLHRRLNAIIYLNREWREEWGGGLELHSDPWSPERNVVKTVLPLFNRCVIFETSERSWHAFRRIALPADKQHLSRKSIALYYYTAQRPAEEIAPPHATFYVHRPLPANIRAGHTLSDADVAELTSLMQRRDGWIRHLYQRELRFSKELAERSTVARSLYLNVKNRVYNDLKANAPGLLSTLQRAVTPVLQTIERRLNHDN